MADYKKIYEWSLDNAHQGRVSVALHSTSTTIVNESTSTPQHDKRLAWAHHFRSTGRAGMPLAQVLLLVITDTPSVLSLVAADLSVSNEDSYSSTLQSATDAVVDAELVRRFGATA